MNYGLNYMGSKNTIAQELIGYMLNRHTDRDTFIDATVGGGAMAHYVIRETENMRVVINDLNPYFTDLYKMMCTYPDVVKEFAMTWVTRAYFKDVMTNLDATKEKWKVAMIVTIWSFGGVGESYLYATDLEWEKRALFDAVMYNLWANELSDFKATLPPTLTIGDGIDVENKRLEILRRYGAYKGKAFQLENVNRAQRLMTMCDDFYNNRRRIHIFNKDYKEFISNLPQDLLKRSIIYIDPPYENTSEYLTNQIDHNEFWTFINSMVDVVPIYASSYEAPDYIKEVWSAGKLVLIAGTKNSRFKTERLFYNNYLVEENSLFDLIS